MENEEKIIELVQAIDNCYGRLSQVSSYMIEYIDRRPNHRNYKDFNELFRHMKTIEKDDYYQVCKSFNKLIQIVEEEPECASYIKSVFENTKNIPYNISAPTTKFVLEYLKEHCMDFKVYPFENLYDINVTALYRLSKKQDCETLKEWGLLDVSIRNMNSLAELTCEPYYYKNLPYFQIKKQLDMYINLIKKWDFSTHLDLLDKLQYLGGLEIKDNTSYEKIKVEEFDNTLSYFEKVSSPATLRNYFAITTVSNLRNLENEESVNHIFDLLMDKDFPIEIDANLFLKSIIGLLCDKKLQKKIMQTPKISSPNDMNNTLVRIARIYGYNNPFGYETPMFNTPSYISDYSKEEICGISPIKINYLLDIPDNDDFETCCLFMQLPGLSDHKHLMDTFMSLDKKKKTQILASILKRRGKENDQSFPYFVNEAKLQQMDDGKYCTSLCLFFFDKLYNIDLSNEIDSMLNFIERVTFKPLYKKAIEVLFDKESDSKQLKSSEETYNRRR